MWTIYDRVAAEAAADRSHASIWGDRPDAAEIDGANTAVFHRPSDNDQCPWCDGTPCKCPPMLEPLPF